MAREIVLGTTGPHGAQRLVLLEDAVDPGMRIYEVRDAYGKEKISFTGEELESLSRLFHADLKRRGRDG